MSLFDDFSKKISNAGQSTIQKTKNIADIARLNSMISDEEKKIKNTYGQIGMQYVEEFGDNPDADFKVFVEAIKESQDKIKEYQHNIAIVKGVKKCPTCGAEVLNEALFCSSCGTGMPKKEEPVAQDVIFCVGCGVALPKESRFCTSCGKPVEFNETELAIANVDSSDEVVNDENQTAN